MRRPKKTKKHRDLSHLRYEKKEGEKTFSAFDKASQPAFSPKKVVKGKSRKKQKNKHKGGYHMSIHDFEVRFIKDAANKRKNEERKNKRKETIDFYESTQWKVLKKSVLITYGCYCMKCQAKNVPIHVDHIRPRSKRKDLELTFNNLQCLCGDCNYEKSNKHETDYRPQHFKDKYPLPD